MPEPVFRNCTVGDPAFDRVREESPQIFSPDKEGRKVVRCQDSQSFYSFYQQHVGNCRVVCEPCSFLCPISFVTDDHRNILL